MSSTPPMAGPTMRPRLNTSALMAMALVISARSSTISLSRVWRIGISKALATPISVATAR